MLIALMVFFLLAVPAALLWPMLVCARGTSVLSRVIAKKRTGLGRWHEELIWHVRRGPVKRRPATASPCIKSSAWYQLLRGFGSQTSRTVSTGLNDRDFIGAIPHPEEAPVVPAADTTAQTGSEGVRRPSCDRVQECR